MSSNEFLEKLKWFLFLYCKLGEAAKKPSKSLVYQAGDVPLAPFSTFHEKENDCPLDKLCHLRWRRGEAVPYFQKKE